MADVTDPDGADVATDREEIAAAIDDDVYDPPHKPAPDDPEE